MAIFRASALVLFLLASYVLPATNQPSPLDFKHFSLDEGLVSYVIMDVERDATGYLWIGTQLGLSRYDGAQMRTFNRRTYESDNLQDDYIQVLEEDASNPGVLWVGTNSGGVSRYDPTTQRFTTFTKSNSGLPSNDVRALYSAPDGTLWIGTADAGLSRYDPASGHFETYRQEAETLNSLVSDMIRGIYAPFFRSGDAVDRDAPGTFHPRYGDRAVYLPPACVDGHDHPEPRCGHRGCGGQRIHLVWHTRRRAAPVQSRVAEFYAI